MYKIRHIYLLNSLFLLIFIISCGSCTTPKGYDISVNPKGLLAVGDTLYMISYDKKSNYIAKAVINNNGIARFAGKPALQSGMYTIVVDDGVITNLDFLISDTQSQKFTIVYDIENLANLRVFIGSKENEAFIRYKKQEAQTSDFKQYPMLSFFIKSITPVSETLDNKIHYFDNTDFSDNRTAKTPILEYKLYDYFFHVLNVLDTTELKQGIDSILYKAAFDEDVYRVSAAFLYDIYINSPLPDHGLIAEYIAKNYILSGFTSIFDSNFIDKVKSETNWINQNPVGSIAPDMKLQSISGDYMRLSDVKAKATILLFLDPDCGVCREVVPQVYKLYQTFKDKDITVYAVYLGYEVNEWKSYIISNKYDWINVWSDDNPEVIYQNYSLLGMPTIYLLDSEKRIIAKDIEIEALGDFLENVVNNK